jgi:hypothetical protein
MENNLKEGKKILIVGESLKEIKENYANYINQNASIMPIINNDLLKKMKEEHSLIYDIRILSMVRRHKLR